MSKKFKNNNSIRKAENKYLWYAWFDLFRKWIHRIRILLAMMMIMLTMIMTMIMMMLVYGNGTLFHMYGDINNIEILPCSELSFPKHSSEMQKKGTKKRITKHACIRTN